MQIVCICVQFCGVERQLTRDLLQSFAGTINDGSFTGALSRTRRIIFAGADF